MNSSMKPLLCSLTVFSLVLSSCNKPAETTASNPAQPTASAPAAPAAVASPQSTPVPALKPVAKLKPNEWPKEVVWYQLFPERFRNGDTSNDPTREALEWPITPSKLWHISSWTKDWYARDDWEKELG